jgi:uncharacterized protein (TIGR03435 family)
MVHRWSLLVGLLFACIPTSAPKAQTAIRLGEMAPPFSTAHILQVPRGTTENWDTVRGKAVVLEFWATWCGGCVENIPHLNELAQRFETEPVVFISVTDEDDLTVSRFLGKFPISGWVVTDSQRDTFRSYGVQGIPQTFLIDAGGVLRAITGPSYLDASVLSDLVGRRKLKLPERKISAPLLLGSESGAPFPLVQVLIRPAAPAEVSGTSPGGEILKDGRYEAFGLTLRDIIANAYEFPDSRIDAPEWCSQIRYDLSVVVPHGAEAEQWPLVQETLAHAFHLRLKRQPVETSVYVLRRAQTFEPKIRVSSVTETNSRPWGGKGEFDAISVKLGTLASIAGGVLHSEVFDETGMLKRYDFNLKWNHNDPSSIITAIRDQLGLELVTQQRQLEHIVVESAYEPKTW